MLGWVKDKIGRKQTPLEALAAGAFKDEAEKQALLEALATTEGLKAEELVPLLTRPDAGIQQRVNVLFLTRATPAAALALADAVFAADAATRPTLLKTTGRLKPELLRHVLDTELREPAKGDKGDKERLRHAWELALDLPAEVSDAYVERALTEGPPKTRADALTRLLAKKTPADLRATLVTALDDREARVRRIAIDALVTLQGNDVFEAMLDRIARDENAEIRSIAGGYLQKFISSAPAEMRPQILGRLLLSGDADVRSQLVRAIFSTGNHYELLLEVLTFAKTVLGVQHESILESLKTIGDGLVEHAIRILAHEDPDLRIQAILILERFTSPKTLPAVIKLLEDGDWWVRIMACDTLGRLRDARTLPHLSRLLADPECKWAAIDAIGTIGGESGFSALLGLLKDRQNEVRLAAVKALGKIDDRRVDQYIEDISKSDPSLDIRIRAVELLRERQGAKGGVDTSVSSDHLTKPMERLLAYAREARASDLIVSPDEPPFLRLNGVIERSKSKTFSRGQVDSLVDELLDPVRRPILAEKGAVDFCYALPGVGRYRVNCFRQLRGTSAVVRVIPNVPPTIADCGLPSSLEEIGMYHQGIILLTGPAGSGKSTSLTAFVNLLNETRNTHILTLEDPIEFLHTPKKALINQREIGRDSKSFAAAMRGALREDPDIIVVGELRDKETIRLAMVAAETGHLVIATMQTTGAVATIDKIVESFPVDEQAQIRVQFAGSLKLILSQVLIPRADGNGRAAAFEILKATSSVAAIIRDGKTFQLGSAMQIGRTQGMLTLDASLEQLLAAKTITLDTAIAFAHKKETFTKAARAAAPKEAVVVHVAADVAPPSLDVDSLPPPSSEAEPVKPPPIARAPVEERAPVERRVVVERRPPPERRSDPPPRAAPARVSRRPPAIPAQEAPPPRQARVSRRPPPIPPEPAPAARDIGQPPPNPPPPVPAAFRLPTNLQRRPSRSRVHIHVPGKQGEPAPAGDVVRKRPPGGDGK